MKTIIEPHRVKMVEPIQLTDRDERERLIEELLRVSRRFVVMTFFDFYSLKNWLRRARRPFNKKPPKMTMTVRRVRELAEANRLLNVLGAFRSLEPSLVPANSILREFVGGSIFRKGH